MASMSNRLSFKAYKVSELILAKSIRFGGPMLHAAIGRIGIEK